jgi:hypothetical protein
MARETKAQREARELKETMERTTVAKSTYVFRMMAVLARATKQNFEMAVYTDKFVLVDRDAPRDATLYVSPVWTDVADFDLYELEMAVEWKEEAAAEAERLRNLRQTALAKLTDEERKALSL